MRMGLAHGCLFWGGCNKPAHPWTPAHWTFQNVQRLPEAMLGLLL